jgi:ribosome-associated protein
MIQETKPRKTIVQKLQRAIVNGLEDVKGQDIVVFNTEHLSPLFERVIIASGTSNRQTKALASSVSDAVKAAGFPKPRVEGEENGEWIIVDCGQAVAHVMQPTIRAYYRLEDIWGGKTVRLKSTTAAAKPAGADAARATRATNAAAATPAKTRSAKTAVPQADSPAAATERPRKTTAKTTAKSTTAKAATTRSAAKTVGKVPAKPASPRSTGRPSAARPSAPIKTVVVGAPVKRASARSAPRTAAKAGAVRRKPAA